MSRRIKNRKTEYSVKLGDVILKKESPKRGDYVFRVMKKANTGEKISRIQFGIDNVKDLPVRIYTKDQIEELSQYNTISYKLNKKSNQRLTWLKFKNVVLGITEKELLSIEKREWNKVPEI